MSSINKEQMDEILNKLKIGSILTKRKRTGDKASYHYFLHKNEHFVSSTRVENAFTKAPRYYIHQIDEIRTGLNTRTFHRLLRHQYIKPEDDQYAFSIFYNNYRREVHLIAEDTETRDRWIQGLQYLMQAHGQKRQRHVIDEASWIMNYFYLADKDGSDTLTKKECRQLLVNSFNAKVSDKEFESLFKEADISGEGLLTSDEFIEFFRLFTRRKDLYRIMKKYVKNAENQSMDTITMSVDELLYFLRNVQNQTVIERPEKQSRFDFSLQLISTLEQAQDLINEFESNIELKQKGQLSLLGFRNLLLADDFALMKPWCSRYIYQDMTRPLNNYYIKTSHNTYLFNNQLMGDSNPEAYNRAFQTGCRAVEIDCYDGDNGRPIVKHGFTLVKPCLFESIIRFIEPNLFKTSPYPVILDLENHCSVEQQHEMARILQDILGDRLVSESLLTKESKNLPSPEDLKYKVLVRGVKIPSPIDMPQTIETKDLNGMANLTVVENGLANLIVYFQNVPYRDYEYAKDNHLCYHSPNVAEKNFDKATKSDPMGVIRQTLKTSLRMYPDGLRQDSSNPDPIYPWNFGVQMVALNYQNDDSVMSLAYGKFMDNGRCGYVLKPPYLIDVDKTLFNPLNYIVKPKTHSDHIIESPQCVIITIISAQFLSRANETTSDIPDPYVMISTHGIACDQQTQKTKTIENNGFDPEWNETFQFDIHFPQMCLVRFDVYDHDTFSRDDRLAYFCLPLTTMQSGYRHIHLRAKNNNLTYSTLFIHVQFKAI
ncbi:unnamed protein product [Adineta steineri]|uniref:Phosphoinositide phospholipase C n=1 Tax=Adineta steineri TaxID=433720 RepID=A0A814TH72_9BILA|nr:unnamed protein product [Adineta steineri]CAF3944217.1 unnamed protein product [Adineta steineri]